MGRSSKRSKVQLESIEPPFSNFDFVDKHFGGGFPIRRLFSQARARHCRTLVIEEIRAFGAVADENREIRRLYPKYRMLALVRISFWKPKLRRNQLNTVQDDECVGYALLKRDYCPGHPRGAEHEDAWHVFEAVFSRPEHPHNYTPCDQSFHFPLEGRQIHIRGVLYGQQNGLNKVCAQVALRSLCATYLRNLELTYSKINRLAGGTARRSPHGGLDKNQIRSVLEGLEIPYFDFDYSEFDESPKSPETQLPFQRIIYSGIESGAGALLGFAMSGPDAGDQRHIIHCYGHTFNADTWAAVADGDYFHVGEVIKHIPSDAWMGSFIVHDDNYGSNLCVQKTYLRADQANYALLLLPKGFRYTGIYAEAAGSYYFSSLVPALVVEDNMWLRRLLEYAVSRKLILRVVPVTLEGYIAHLKAARDWLGNQETAQVINQFGYIHTKQMWMVEVSVPDLFPTNKRKIGELLLDATRDFETEADFRLFVLARFPGAYLFFHGMAEDGEPRFIKLPSELRSHVPVLAAQSIDLT